MNTLFVAPPPPECLAHFVAALPEVGVSRPELLHRDGAAGQPRAAPINECRYTEEGLPEGEGKYGS